MRREKRKKGRTTGPFSFQNGLHLLAGNPLSHLKIGDGCVIGIILACIVISMIAFPIHRKEGRLVTVIQDSRIAERYPLSGEKTIVMHCTTGIFRIQIRNGSVWVEEAHCPRQICMKAKKISRAGQMIVCIPNHILIRIEGQSEGTLDGVTQ